MKSFKYLTLENRLTTISRFRLTWRITLPLPILKPRVLRGVRK
ncbi:MAG: hypothetical protein QW304_03850 [Thermoproteota archaeon]